MPQTTTQLREEFDTLKAAALATLQTAQKEARPLTDDEKAENDKRFTRCQAIQAHIADESRFAAAMLPAAIDPAILAAATGNAPAGRQAPSPDRREQYRRALNSWANSGRIPEEFATITTSTTSGILLPKEVMQPLNIPEVNAFREAAQVAGFPGAIMSTAGTATINIPVLDASAGGVVTETDSSENENPPSLTESLVMTCATYESGSAWFSDLVIGAQDFDVETAALPALQMSKELGLEAAIAAAIIADSGITQSEQTASNTTLAYDDLVNLNQALPKRYDKFKVIFLSRTAYAYAEGLIATDGHPVLVQDVQNQSLKRFNGTPVIRCDSFEAITKDNVVGCIISLLGFRLRDAGQARLARYADVPARPAQTGFNLFAFHAYDWAPSAVAKLVTCNS